MPPGSAQGVAGKRVVLTGASRGIGRAAALRLARAGARVLAVARDAEALAALAFEAKPLPGQVFPHSCDLTSEGEVEALAEIAARRLGRGGRPGEQRRGGRLPRPGAAHPRGLRGHPGHLPQGALPPPPRLRPLPGGFGRGRGEHLLHRRRDGVPRGGGLLRGQGGPGGDVPGQLRGRGIRLSVLRPGATATGMWKDIPGEFDTEKMIPPELVAESLEFLLAQSRRVWTETMVVLPPDGRV